MKYKNKNKNKKKNKPIKKEKKEESIFPNYTDPVRKLNYMNNSKFILSMFDTSRFIKFKKEEKVEDYNLNILGYEFVKNNKNKAKLIIKNKKSPLMEFIKINENENNKIKISMVLSKDISNGSCMFKNCENLVKLSFNFDRKIIQNDELYLPTKIEENENIIYSYYTNSDDNEFSSYSNFKSNNILSKDSELISTEKDEYYDNFMFFLNNKLMNKQNIFSNLNRIFENCKSLKTLPDISQWNTFYVQDMSHIFYNCTSLLSLPDINL